MGAPAVQAVTATATTSTAPVRRPGGASDTAASASSTPPARAVPTAARAQATSVPARVAPDDRAEYLQILKTSGGNAATALAALQMAEAGEKGG
jgi:hypothetical protein